VHLRGGDVAGAAACGAAGHGQLSKAQTIERAPEPRKTALLMATRLINPARRASNRERLAVLPQMEKAARTLARASKILVEELDRVAEHDANLDVTAALITAQGRVELAQMWGGGMLASVDGLRFVVPVKSINTGTSPKYYGYKPGPAGIRPEPAMSRS
jgi:hypothetical protein